MRDTGRQLTSGNAALRPQPSQITMACGKTLDSSHHRLTGLVAQLHKELVPQCAAADVTPCSSCTWFWLSQSWGMPLAIPYAPKIFVKKKRQSTPSVLSCNILFNWCSVFVQRIKTAAHPALSGYTCGSCASSQFTPFTPVRLVRVVDELFNGSQLSRLVYRWRGAPARRGV